MARALRGAVALASLLLVAFLNAGRVLAESEAPALDADTLAKIDKMRIKELKAELAERGLECVACAEKSDVVAMLKANWAVPKGQKKPEAKASGKASADSNTDTMSKEEREAELDELLEKLQRDSGQKFKVFKASDLKDKLKKGGKGGEDPLKDEL